MDFLATGAWFQPTLSARLLRPFTSLLAEAPRSTTLRIKELHELSQEEARIPLRSALAWLEEITDGLGDPDAGLRALGHVQRGLGDVVELGAASANSLGDALSFLSTHIRILNEAAAFQLRIEGQAASFELRSRLKLPRILVDYQAGTVFLAIRRWLGEAADFQVWFSYPAPERTDAHRSIFGRNQLRFDAPCDALVFGAYRLKQRLRSADATLHGVLRRYAERLVSGEAEGRSLVLRVREAIFDLLPLGAGDASSVAKRLGMSRRTLTRHLAREDATFRQLLDEVRHQRALRYLEATNLDLQRMAQLLGYAETASFCRAFVRWRRQSPLQYRRSCSVERAQNESSLLEARS